MHAIASPTLQSHGVLGSWSPKYARNTCHRHSSLPIKTPSYERFPKCVKPVSSCIGRTGTAVPFFLLLSVDTLCSTPSGCARAPAAATRWTSPWLPVPGEWQLSTQSRLVGRGLRCAPVPGARATAGRAPPPAPPATTRTPCTAPASRRAPPRSPSSPRSCAAVRLRNSPCPGPWPPGTGVPPPPPHPRRPHGLPHPCATRVCSQPRPSRALLRHRHKSRGRAQRLASQARTKQAPQSGGVPSILRVRFAC